MILFICILYCNLVCERVISSNIGIIFCFRYFAIKISNLVGQIRYYLRLLEMNVESLDATKGSFLKNSANFLGVWLQK